MRKQLSMTEVSALLHINQQQAPLNPVLKNFNTRSRAVSSPETVAKARLQRQMSDPIHQGISLNPNKHFRNNQFI